MIRRTQPERQAASSPSPADDPGAVRAAAVTLLTRRDFSSAALGERLRRRGFDMTLVASVLADLSAERALDDERYARNFVAYRAERGQGPVRIAADLAAQGLSGEQIDAALASGPDWAALARRVRKRKFGANEPEFWAERTRQARFLQYRGFSSDHIRSALGPDVTAEE